MCLALCKNNSVIICNAFDRTNRDVGAVDEIIRLACTKFGFSNSSRDRPKSQTQVVTAALPNATGANVTNPRMIIINRWDDKPQTNQQPINPFMRKVYFKNIIIRKGHMRFIYVNIQHINVDMQYKYACMWMTMTTYNISMLTCDLDHVICQQNCIACCHKKAACHIIMF